MRGRVTNEGGEVERLESSHIRRYTLRKYKCNGQEESEDKLQTMQLIDGRSCEQRSCKATLEGKNSARGSMKRNDEREGRKRWWQEGRPTGKPFHGVQSCRGADMWRVTRMMRFDLQIRSYAIVVKNLRSRQLRQNITQWVYGDGISLARREFSSGKCKMRTTQP